MFRFRSGVIVIFFVLSAMLLTAVPGFAQTATQFGVQGGVNVANADFKGSDPEFNPDFKSRTRGVFGAFVAWDFKPNLGLQIDALYSQKGTKFNTQEVFEGIPVDFAFEASLDYLEFPILLRTTFPSTGNVRARIFGGPSFAFKVSDEVTFTANGVSFEDEELPEFKSNDFGFVIGGAVEFGKIFFDVRYNWGLIDINDTEDDSDEVKTRTFGFMVGFRFK